MIVTKGLTRKNKKFDVFERIMEIFPNYEEEIYGNENGVDLNVIDMI